MPQPITKIVRDPRIFLTTDALADKPELAILVTKIFAVWARIEQELNFLLVRVLGADAAPAIAMFQTLTAQHLQLGALDAAAKAALSTEDFQIFAAAVSTAESSQTPRNHLAHWAWGACEQRPDLLVLANPKMLRERDFRVAKGVASKIEPRKIAELNLFDVSEALAYSKSDLERALRDLEECYFILESLATYLNPDQLTGLGFLPADTDLSTVRAEILQRLSETRLFREALARIRGDQQSTQQSPPESPPPKPVES